jgi:hypothetical protein
MIFLFLLDSLNKSLSELVKWGWIKTFTQLVAGGSCRNPSFSGGRNQEDRVLKPAWANCYKTLSKKKSRQRAGGVAQGVGPEFKPQYHKQKQKKPLLPRRLLWCSNVHRWPLKKWSVLTNVNSKVLHDCCIIYFLFI